MSIVGGAAVFSTLGFLANEVGKPIEEVVSSSMFSIIPENLIAGVGLVFVVYPEAMSQMPFPYLWAFAFFLVIFLLGISTQFGK